MSKLENIFGEGWYGLLGDLLTSEDFKNVGRTLNKSKKKYYPEREDIFNAFKLCPLWRLKVVILGQDPYHDGSATGLAFSNRSDSTTLSPSLRNIFKEEVLKKISEELPAIVYILWGSHARQYLKYINRETNFVLVSPHPSPFSASRGFFGNNHFNKCNQALKEVGIAEGEMDYEIEW